MSRSCFPIFSFGSFMISGLTFKSLINFVLFFVYGWDKGPISFFCMWTSIFPSTIYWRDYPFPIVCFWHPCQRSVDCRFVDLFLCSCWSICLFLCQYHIVLITVALKIWNQELWCLQLCSSRSRLLWLFGVFCGSI